MMWNYVYKHFLKDAFVYPRGGPAISGNHCSKVYTRVITTGMKEQIIKAFQKEWSSLTVVFATIAFGMGLDIPDIEQVIHVGPSTDNGDYAQQIDWSMVLGFTMSRRGCNLPANDIIWTPTLSGTGYHQHIFQIHHQQYLCLWTLSKRQIRKFSTLESQGTPSQHTMSPYL